jgi:hypothetical protein
MAKVKPLSEVAKEYAAEPWRDLVGEPTIPTMDAWSPAEVIAELKTEIEKLKKAIQDKDAVIKTYEEDGQYAQFFAMNRKSNETAASLNSFTLSLTGMIKPLSGIAHWLN